MSLSTRLTSAPALLLGASTLALGLVSPAQAQSLYAAANPHDRSAFADRTATRPGDVVTIVVNERLLARQDDGTSMSKEGSFRAALDAFGINPATFGATLPDIGASSSRDYDGESSITRDGRLQARLTGQVHAITENGLLVVVAHKTVKIDSNTRALRVRGVIRPEDVDAANQIPSDRLADATMELIGEGFTDTEPGLVARLIHAILDLIWPF